MGKRTRFVVSVFLINILNAGYLSWSLGMPFESAYVYGLPFTALVATIIYWIMGGRFSDKNKERS